MIIGLSRRIRSIIHFVKKKSHISRDVHNKIKLNYCSFQMKIENKLGLSWAKLSRQAKLSHPNSIELRSTAVSRISCSWKSQTELVCYKMCIFQQVKYKKADVKRIHIVDWNIYVIFINHLDHLKKIFQFWLQIQLK